MTNERPLSWTESPGSTNRRYLACAPDFTLRPSKAFHSGFHFLRSTVQPLVLPLLNGPEPAVQSFISTRMRYSSDILSSDSFATIPPAKFSEPTPGLTTHTHHYRRRSKQRTKEEKITSTYPLILNAAAMPGDFCLWFVFENFICDRCSKPLIVGDVVHVVVNEQLSSGNVRNHFVSARFADVGLGVPASAGGTGRIRSWW